MQDNIMKMFKSLNSIRLLSSFRHSCLFQKKFWIRPQKLFNWFSVKISENDKAWNIEILRYFLQMFVTS